MLPCTRLLCAPRTGLAASAGALGWVLGDSWPSFGSEPLPAPCCLCLTACGGHKLRFNQLPGSLSHLPYSPRSACVGTCGVSPREEGAGPGATQPVFSFTSLLGPLWVGGFVLLPSVPPPCPFFCLLQSSFEAMCVHKIIGEPVGCPCSKPSALPCSVVARAGNRCCCCGWAENTGLAFCFSALRANSVFRSSKNFLFWSIPLKGSRLSAGSFRVQASQRTPASVCHLLVVRYQHVKAKPLLWD